MTFEHPCERKLTQFVSDHIFGDKNLVKYFAVVDEKRKTDELWNYRAPSGPGFNRLARAGRSLFVDFDKQLLVNIRSFF